MLTSIVVFLLSASLLACEVALMRVFAVTQWSHFAYLVISIALLGFGASGTLVTVGGAWLRRRERTAVPILATLFAAAMPVCCDLAQRTDLNVLALPWSGRQMWLLAGVALILMVPFLLGAAAIALLLSVAPARAPAIYAANLLGSGAGALGVVVLLWAASPGEVLLILCGITLAGAGLAWCRHGPRRAAAGIAGSAALAAALLAAWRSGSHFPTLRVSEFKALSITLNLPYAERRAHARSPMGQLDVVASPVIREAPGLSFAFRGAPPAQMLAFSDADAPSAVNLWRDRDDLRCFDYLTAAAPFHVRPPSRMCVIGAGGGTDIDLAHYHGVPAVCAVELNGRLLDVLQAARGPDGTPYDPRVMRGLDLVIAEGRGHLERTRDRYDLIQISLVDSFSASSAGVYALSESYLYTVEALQAYLRRLTPAGTLSLTRWLKRPPRDVIKLFATAAEALEAEGLDPRDRLILIRSWKTATLLAAPRPFTAEEIGRLRAFCQERAFDVAYYPGVRAEEANRFHVYEQPVYYQAAQAILFGDRRRYIEGSFFDLRPATDDRPFFFHFFRPRMLPRVRQMLGRNWRPFVEWGYVVVLVTLAAAVVLSAILILAPLALVRPGRRGGSTGRPASPACHRRPAVIGYCLALGLGFMFIEMAFIQKFILFLSHPLYAISVIIAGFLVLAGAGSWLAGRLGARPGLAVAVAVALIAAVSVAYALWLTPLLRHLIGWPDWARVATTVGLLAPLAVPMGVPFPTALRRLGEASPALVPWAWAINGCASVTAASLATALAVSVGFRGVVAAAVVLYAAAGVLFLQREVMSVLRSLIRRFLPEKARHGAHALRGILAYDRGRRRSTLRGPLGVQIQTIDRCNAACLMCPYATTAHKGPAYRMDDALYTHILRELRRTGVTQSVCLMLQNEPLLDRRLPELVRQAKEAIRGVRVSTVTNGALLTPERIDALRASGLDSVAVSIDAASEATYRRVRRGLDFATVVANTEALLRHGGPIRVTARFLRQRANEGEERAFAAYWRPRGARINFNPLTNRAGELAAFESLRAKRRPVRAVVGALLNRIMPACPLPFARFGILWDGRVILCCHDWGPREVMGDLSRQSIEAVWNGEAINRHRSLLLAGRSEASTVCRGCSLAHGFWNT